MAPDGATTLGTPICVLVRNGDQKSGDYSEMEQAYRPSHAGARWGAQRGSSGLLGPVGCSLRSARARCARPGLHPPTRSPHPPSTHSDATYDFKYGIRAVAGGGRSSARETIGRVAAGAVAKKLLHQVGC